MEARAVVPAQPRVWACEQKIKEGLYMMGLKDRIFCLSWYIFRSSSKYWMHSFCFLFSKLIQPQNIEIPSLHSSGNASLLMLLQMQFSPSNIGTAPTPTREYTDDEFQYVIKEVMGVLN
ncbi:abc transporter a family member 1 [Quercus suber]|uniref:Abc transporter a family member 1 n=1 Tax=Quercus suber TaxID=58331 RepID=A0AAW0M057_QUESU